MQLGIPNPKLMPRIMPSAVVPKGSDVLRTRGVNEAKVPTRIQNPRKRVLFTDLLVREAPTIADNIRAPKWALQTNMFVR